MITVPLGWAILEMQTHWLECRYMNQIKHNLTDQCCFQRHFLAELVAAWSGYQADLAGCDHHGQVLAVVHEAQAGHGHCLVAAQHLN